MKQTVLMLLLVTLVAGKNYLMLSADECSSSGKTLTFPRCRIDATHKVFMVQANVTKKVFKFKVSCYVLDETFQYGQSIPQISSTLHLLVGTGYKQIFKFGDIDWCQFMSKQSLKSASTAKIIIDAIKKSSGNLFHECPYFGDYEANITISKSVFSLFPNGLYKVTVGAKNEFDDDFFHVLGIIELKD